MIIDSVLYNNIIDVIPILCVDGFIIQDGRILLLKRNNYPALNEWWVPGGRVLKNEYLLESIVRKVKEETGLDVEVVEQVGITETIFDNKKHTVNVCFFLKIKPGSGSVKLNSDHSEFNWFEIGRLPDNLNSELVRIIKKIK